jgi:hypothetical protein
MARKKSVTASSVEATLPKSRTPKASRQASPEKRRFPSANAVRKAFHDLLHQIDPLNHRETEQFGGDGNLAEGFVCNADLPPAFSDESGSAGEFVVSVLFGLRLCEVWLGFEADEFYEPESPLVSYPYSDPDLLEKLFRRLEALCLYIPGDFWLKLATPQNPAV